MSRVAHVVAGAVAGVLVLLTGTGALVAQAPMPGAAPPGDVVVGSGNYSPIVTDLDKAIEFYGTLLGLTVPPSQTPGPRPYNTDQAVHRMFGVPGAQLRFVTARIPGATVGVEMVEVQRAPDRKRHTRGRRIPAARP